MSEPVPTVVLGFGLTGQSVARYLMARDNRPIVLDSRPAQTLSTQWDQLEIHWGVEDWPSQVLRHADRVVVSPGLPPHHSLVRQAREAGLPVVSDIDLFMSEIDAPVVGVTGTNGKSTVVSLIGHLLQSAGMKCRVGGNLGVPALELLKDDCQIVVLELSSFQLAHSERLKLASAGVLNISDDHRDWHLDFDSYQKAKLSIYASAAYRVGRPNDETPMDAYVASGSPCIGSWQVSQKNEVPWLYFDKAPLLPVSELPLAGAHNAENCLWAMALVQPWIDPEKACRLLSGFTGLPHRFTSVKGPEGIRCINDSKATNVGSTLAALTGFKQDAKLILIAGGDSKDADLKPLGAAMHGRVRLLITLGQDAQKLNTVAEERDIAWRQVNDMDQAVAVALAHAEAGDTVLLSPACASLDMYPNFAARGDDFAQCVAQHSASLQPKETS